MVMKAESKPMSEQKPFILPNGLVQGSDEDRATWWECAYCGFHGPYVGETATGSRACLGSCGGIKRNPACTWLAPKGTPP